MTLMGGHAYLALRNHGVYEIDPGSTTIRRRLTVDGIAEATPAVGGGHLFVSSFGTVAVRSDLYALDLRTGRIAWTFRTGGFTSVSGGPTFARGRVYAGFGDGTVRAFDAATGREIWMSPLREAMGPSAVAVVRRRRVYVNDRLGGLYALESSDGRRVWDFQFPAYSVWSAPIVTRTVAYVGSDDGAIGAVSLAAGHLVWKTSLRFGAIGPLGAGDGELLAPLLGRSGGVAIFAHSSSAQLLDEPSPSVLDIPRGVANGLIASAAVFVAAILLFRVVLNLRRMRTGRGRRGATGSEGAT
jgi:outer membrane protein assembly factor BamB